MGCRPTGGKMTFDPGRFACTLVAGMTDAVIYADEAGLIRVWNAGAVRMFGFTGGTRWANRSTSSSPEACKPGTGRAVAKPCEPGRPSTRMVRYWRPAVRKDGTRLSVELTIVPFTGEDGTMTGITAIMRDVTARFEELRTLRKEIAASRAGDPG
jgi:PAS domain-containing protein